jgi:hypothetical protein
MQCSKKLAHVTGRKQKSFCNANCRNKYFYAQRKKEIESAKALLISLPSDYVEIKNVAILTKEGEVKPILPKNPQNKLAKILSSHVDLGEKINLESKGVSTHPRNLEELKKLCPPELTGLDRSAWISTERQKYGV